MRLRHGSKNDNWMDMENEGRFYLQCGKMESELAIWPDNAFDSIVTDPPYGFSFMGKQWDYQVPTVDQWREALRVLKPGGYLLSFGGSRTFHRVTVNIEDAGFEIRDTIMWLYAQGFPKSLNLKDEFEGWGTGLKPAFEPIIVARKPLDGTVLQNMQEWGTGAMNIDASRVPLNGEQAPSGSAKRVFVNNGFAEEKKYGENKETSLLGRFPANVIHDGSIEVTSGFPVTKSGKPGIRKKEHKSVALGKLNKTGEVETGYGDEGSTARFFYCAKATKQDRDEGMDEQNTHPTVKPTALMRYLVKLVTPKGGLVLDPFMGSGSTGKAAMMEGCRFVGIDDDKNIIPVASARIKAVI